VNEGYSAIAAALIDLTRQAEDALAGGQPPKAVAQWSVGEARQIAWWATLVSDGKLAPAALDNMLRGEGQDTLMLARPRPEPPTPGPWGRVVRYVSERLTEVRAGVRR
jgi:hypothetical protein